HAAPDISPLSLHDALPISPDEVDEREFWGGGGPWGPPPGGLSGFGFADLVPVPVAVDAGKQAGPAAVMPEVPGLVTLAVIRAGGDRKSTRLNSSHVAISYA